VSWHGLRGGVDGTGHGSTVRLAPPAIQPAKTSPRSFYTDLPAPAEIRTAGAAPGLGSVLAAPHRRLRPRVLEVPGLESRRLDI
jgi:hypothetical protein